MSVFVLGIYVGLGLFAGPLSSYLLPVTLIAAAATLVESLPHKDIDNITVTLVSAVLGYFLFAH